ncbi:MAG: glutathione S-transferase family protein [Rhodospirillaceae bacterium]|jgi:glutathione S-transferase|nr:glutathione S-transferase family protein [Rhodospirillaceae bacterium]MBT5194117.1 glutathione S-transferase family protein [Rhodospirillaceae bacterium]MBT5898601.1 glutathione S-transferase family protein [Rhodospirillaceae bacterium]MBT6430906.1 glutathione S-transferase family protein [Rhodospirillaceae bacterium]MBT7756245.1 glutathione S-transferase family protein [Rhodospirillaceae bacterium]
MPGYRLIIGDRNLSSWSLRAWLLLRQFGLPFEEVLIHLDQPDTRRKILDYSAAGRVPVLVAGDQTIWDSLAITEFVAEQHPELAIWPRDAKQRARARVMAAEMHAGFQTLREELSFNVQAPAPHPLRGEGLNADITRIREMWRRQLDDKQAPGDFLFGSFCAVDAMYAPVAVRFHLYKVPLDATCRAYMDVVLQLPGLRTWLADAAAEVAPSGSG